MAQPGGYGKHLWERALRTRSLGKMNVPLEHTTFVVTLIITLFCISSFISRIAKFESHPVASSVSP